MRGHLRSTAVSRLSQVLPPAYGRILGGTTVIIRGTNFIGTTYVTFGGKAATAFTVNNATYITATTPVHAAGAVNVVVTNACGTATRTYTYADPTITSMSGTITGARGTTVTNIRVNGANYITSPVPTIIFFRGVEHNDSHRDSGYCNKSYRNPYHSRRTTNRFV